MMKAMLVEDEVKSLRALETMLQSYSNVLEITGAFTSPVEAVQAINRKPPDLLFLDIEMPRLNGFQLLEQVKDITFPVIFTTAYDQFAIQAFRYSAAGYLLKPIDRDDLEAALRKVQTAEMRQLLPAQMDILKQSMRGGGREQKIALPTSDGLLFVAMSDIVRCESDSNYTRIFFASREKMVICRTLKEIEEILGEQNFARVHQSHLVNMNFIKQLVRADGGYLLMNDNTEVPIARSKKDQFLLKCSSFFST